jgi:hypothetical protein
MGVSASHKSKQVPPTGRCGLGEERKHMYIYRINRIQYILCATSLLIPIRHFADSHGNIQAGQICLGCFHLGSELGVR